MSTAVVSPLVPILSLQGTGLNNGSLYVGVLGEDPKTNPIACYWDAALTIAASQPIPILGGYAMYLGSPHALYTATSCTIGAFASDGTLVYQTDVVADTLVTWQTLPFEFLGGVAPASNEVMGLYVAERSLTFFANFDGSGQGFAGPVGKCLGNPTAGTFTITVNKNGSPVGTITVSTGGAWTFATTSGLSFSMIAGNYLEFVAQTTVDSTFLNASWTLTAQATT